MSFTISTSDELNKFTCGEKCDAVLEVSNVKQFPNAKFRKTIIQARTSDQKYLVIIYDNMIEGELMSGDIVFFMDIVVGRQKSPDNVHFTYDWELKRNSKVRLIERNGQKIGQDILIGGSPSTPNTTGNEPKTPKTLTSPLNPLKKTFQPPGSPKKEGPKTGNNTYTKNQNQNQGKKEKKNPSDSKSVISVTTNKQKNPAIQGLLYEEFKLVKYIDENNEIELYSGKVKKLEGDIFQVCVKPEVKLPLILRKGYFIQVGGKDVLLSTETVRMVEHDTQLIFKGFGLIDQHEAEMKKFSDMKITPEFNPTCPPPRNSPYSTPPLTSFSSPRGLLESNSLFSRLSGRQPPNQY